MTDPTTVDPFDVVKCKGCGKDVFPSERLVALKVIWHRGCLKCTTCGVVLNQKTLESFQNQPYCKAHLPKAKVGGGTQTAYAGSSAAANQPRVTAGEKNWDPAAEISAAKAHPNAAGGDAGPVGTAYHRPDPKAEIAAAKAKGYQAPEETRAEHDSQKRRDPAAEVRAAKSTAASAGGGDAGPVGTAYHRPDPMAEIAAARAQGSDPTKDTPPPPVEYQREHIRGGNVSAFKQKFSEPAAPAAPPPTAAKPAKAAPKFKPAPQLPPPEPEAAPQEQPQEQPPEEQHEQQQQEQPPEEQQYEPPAVEQPAQEPPAEGGVYATASFDYSGEQEGDLAFKAGDQILILDQSDPSGWWQGQVNGVTGVFPSNFVQLNQ